MPNTFPPHTARRRRLGPSLAIVGALATTWVATAAHAQPPAHRTIAVRPGVGTISAAVATAHPGDTLALSPGTFFDSVLIPIPLIVRGAGPARTVIRPPERSFNPCNVSTTNGLCVIGGRDPHGGPDQRQPARNVTISKLRVAGFSGSGVFGFNTDRLRVQNVRADHNGAYGIARFISTRSTLEDDVASYNNEAGLYVGDSPGAHTVVRRNLADHNGFGIFVRDSTEVTAAGNHVWDNCAGIFALDSGEGAAGDLPAGGLSIVHNVAWDNDRACPAGEHLPFSGIGIGLLGVRDTTVRRNVVFDNRPTGPSAASGGIAVASTRAGGGADPQYDTVQRNVAFGNQPADIAWDRTGADNVISGNDCATTLPTGLGGCAAGSHRH